MSKMNLLSVFAAFVIACAAAGCVVVKEIAPAKEQVKINPVEYQLAKKLINSFVVNDAQTFVSLLSEVNKEKFTAESFAQTRKAVIDSVGEPVEYSYVTSLELKPLTPQIWKLRMRRRNINNTKEYTSEILMRIITGMVNDKEAVVTGFQFL